MSFLKKILVGSLVALGLSHGNVNANQIVNKGNETIIYFNHNNNNKDKKIDNVNISKTSNISLLEIREIIALSLKYLEKGEVLPDDLRERVITYYNFGEEVGKENLKILNYILERNNKIEKKIELEKEKKLKKIDLKNPYKEFEGKKEYTLNDLDRLIDIFIKVNEKYASPKLISKMIINKNKNLILTNNGKYLINFPRISENFSVNVLRLCEKHYVNINFANFIFLIESNYAHLKRRFDMGPGQIKPYILEYYFPNKVYKSESEKEYYLFVASILYMRDILHKYLKIEKTKNNNYYISLKNFVKAAFFYHEGGNILHKNLVNYLNKNKFKENYDYLLKVISYYKYFSYIIPKEYSLNKINGTFKVTETMVYHFNYFPDYEYTFNEENEIFNINLKKD